jgi:hypothetical protein
MSEEHVSIWNHGNAPIRVLGLCSMKAPSSSRTDSSSRCVFMSGDVNTYAPDHTIVCGCSHPLLVYFHRWQSAQRMNCGVWRVELSSR